MHRASCSAIIWRRAIRQSWRQDANAPSLLDKAALSHFPMRQLPKLGPPHPESRPDHSDEQNQPDEVSAPAPSVVIELGRASSVRSLSTPTLDVARIGSAPSSVAPAVANRRDEEQEHDRNPDPPPGAHHHHRLLPLRTIHNARFKPPSRVLWRRTHREAALRESIVSRAKRAPCYPSAHGRAERCLTRGSTR